MPSRLLISAVAVLLGLARFPAAAPSQQADSLKPPMVSVRPFPSLGGWEAEERRLAEVIGARPAESSLLRSASSTLRAGERSSWAPRFQLLLPVAEVRWNSDIPFSMNDGALRPERGMNASVVMGVRASLGPLTLVVAPEYLSEANQDFAPLDSLRSGDFLVETRRDTLSTPWYSFEYGADIPLRFGYDRRRGWRPGQSSLSLALGPISAGVSTENHWWGPGVRNALLLSNHAPGLPHAFLRTARPLRTPIGSFESQWLVGELRESEYFDTTAVNDRRAISAFALTYSPAGEPNLQLGLGRSVYTALPQRGEVRDHAADVFTQWAMVGDVDSKSPETHQQILSLFGRWVFPQDGLEVYGEWARQRLPTSVDDFLKYPGFSHGYTVGLQGARRGFLGGLHTLAAELSYLEQTRHGRSPGSFYTSPHVIQGYTHEGQVLGAAIGPGASSQWLQSDFQLHPMSVGVFGARIRWDNDAYFTKRSGPRNYFGHDVSMIAGLRAGFTSRLARIDAEVFAEQRYNYHYQNFAYNWETADSAVDVRNHSIRLRVTPLVLTRRPVDRMQPLPVPPPVPPPGPAPLPEAPPETVPAPRLDTARNEQTPAVPRESLPLPTATRRPTEHRVQAGETFFGIARHYRTTVTALQRANPGVRPDRIHAGQLLRLPADSGRTSGPRSHRVRPGATLTGLSRQYGVSIERIRAANRLTGDRILAGQLLVIPATDEGAKVEP